MILECIWQGTLAISPGNIPEGGQMVAHFAQIFEFKDGKIFRQEIMIVLNLFDKYSNRAQK